MQNRSPAVGFILITLLLDVLGFGLLIPVGPILIKSLLASEGGATDERAAAIVGGLAAMYAAMQFLFGPLLGALSDRFGRRPVLLLALFGSGLDYFAMALAPTLWFFFITRAINGISGASMSVCNAYIADITPPEKRAAAFGMVGAVFGIGFVLGPLAGGLLGGIDVRLPFYVAGGVTLINWLYGLIVLPESLPKELRTRFHLSRANPVGAVKNLAKYPLVAGLSVSFFFLQMAMFGLHATWVLYTTHRYQWTSFQVGLSLALVGIGAAVVQGGLARKLIPALGEARSVLIGIAIGAAAYVAYGASTEGWMIYATIAIASLGGIAQPAAMAIITKTVRPDEQGTMQGAMVPLQSAAQIIGPILGAGAFAYFISDLAPVQIPGASFYLSAIFAVIGLVIAAYVLARFTPTVTRSPEDAEPPTR
ncbi:MAG: TCR/Tet family MFS transporter [Phycisphaerae bacterium]|nr:TCR/Tet family MFS transporter [Phycisphaerae bacterium]